MADDDPTDAAFNAHTARMIHREALRRAAADLNTASPVGLENELAKVAAEVTQEAEARRVAATRLKQRH
jgi:hypothetical protein